MAQDMGTSLAGENRKETREGMERAEAQGNLYVKVSTVHRAAVCGEVGAMIFSLRIYYLLCSLNATGASRSFVVLCCRSCLTSHAHTYPIV